MKKVMILQKIKNKNKSNRKNPNAKLTKVY